MSGFKVGQKVLIRFPGHRRTNEHEVEVTRVGRKYVYVTSRYGTKDEDGEPFSKETGVGKYGAFGGQTTQIGTPEMFAERDRRNAAKQRVNDLTRDYGWTARLSADDMDAISDIIEKARATHG